MDEAKSTGSFLSELRRRKVIRTCLLYILVCWGVLQVLDIVAPALGYDADLMSRYFLYAAVLGFPVNFALAWFYQISSHGIVRTQSFVERRMLDNIPPVNDKRRHGVSTFLRKGEEGKEVHWVISAETGPLSGLSYPVLKPITLGRALECDLAVVTPHVSRQHARLDVENGQLFVEDLGSSNGTMINGKRSSGRQQLRHDDELRFHDIIFRVTENMSRPASERQASDQTTFIHASELEKHG
jgi:FHA domain